MSQPFTLKLEPSLRAVRSAPTPTATLFSLADIKADAGTTVEHEAPNATSVSRIQWDDKPKHPSDRSEPGKPSKWPRVLLGVNIACLTTTVAIAAIMAGSFQPWRTLTSISEKIEGIEKAEQRLRFEIVNAASRIDGLLQLRMDRADATQYQVLQGLGALRTSVESTAVTLRDTGLAVDDRLSALLVSIAEITLPVASPATERRSGPKTVAALPSSFETTGSIPAPKASPRPAADAPATFERHQMPDGSVAYRRVN